MTGPAESGPVTPGPRRRRRWKRVLAEAGITILAALLLAGFVRAFVFQNFWIPTSSMVPTLGVYDRVLVQKAFFTWQDVREGDIVVFSHAACRVDTPPPRRATGAVYLMVWTPACAASVVEFILIG